MLFYSISNRERKPIFKEEKLEMLLEESERLNNNTDLPFEFMKIIDTKRESASIEYAEVAIDKGDGDVISEDNNVRCYYDNYKIDGVNNRIGEIIIFGGEYNIFGVSVGDNTNKYVKVLKEEGYRVIDSGFAYPFG